MATQELCNAPAENEVFSPESVEAATESRNNPEDGTGTLQALLFPEMLTYGL